MGGRLVDDLSGAGGCLPCRPLPAHEACEWVDWCGGQAYQSLDQGLPDMPDMSDKKIGSEKIPASVSPDLSQKCHSWVLIYESALTQNRQATSLVAHCPPFSAGDVGSIPGRGTNKIPWGMKWQPNPSRVLAWKIPWTEEPGGLQCMGLQSQTATNTYKNNQVLLKPFLLSQVTGMFPQKTPLLISD